MVKVVLKEKAISLLEILIAMMILAFVLAGLVNIFVVSKRYLSHSRYRVAATQLGKLFLEPLQNEVRADNWDTSANLLFQGGSNPISGANLNSALFSPRTIDGITYSANYTITNSSDPQQLLRKVVVNITWNEP
ncbi:MAG: hypothetical protein N2606_05330 [Candidatus Omnitrophica bacterium]|nr:hypothetical protein [Candidatus Omnitrophota bacterium]